MIKPVLCAILLFLIQVKSQGSMLLITNRFGKVINNKTLYYRDIMPVIYTCEHKFSEKITLIWKQEKGPSIIYFPSRQVKTYSITVDLERYDDAYKWCCTAYNKYNLETACVQTEVKPRNVHEEILLSTKHESCFDDDNSHIGTVYSLESRKTKTKLNLSKICVTMITEYTSPTEARSARYVFNYKSGPEKYKNDSSSTTKNYQKYIPTNTYKEEHIKSGTVQADGMLWKIGIGAGVTFLIIVIIIIIIRRKRQRNTQAPEEVYASPHEVVYADLQIHATSGEPPSRNDVAYAQVIGVLLKKKRNK